QKVMRLFADEISVGVAKCGELVRQVVFAVDVVVVHFRDNVSASSFDSEVEACAQGEISRCGNNSEVVYREVLSARTEVGGWLESMSDQDEFAVPMHLLCKGGEHIAEMVWAIRGNDR